MLYTKDGITESKASCYRVCFVLAALHEPELIHGANSRRRPNLETYFHHDCRDFYIVFVNGGMKSKLILWLLRPCILNFDYHFLKESFHKKTAFSPHSHAVHCNSGKLQHRHRAPQASDACGAGVRAPRVTLQCVWVQLSWARIKEIWHFEIVICWFASLLPRFQYSFVNRFAKPELRISKIITNVYVFKRLSDFLVKIRE